MLGVDGHPFRRIWGLGLIVLPTFRICFAPPVQKSLFEPIGGLRLLKVFSIFKLLFNFMSDFTFQTSHFFNRIDPENRSSFHNYFTCPILLTSHRTFMANIGGTIGAVGRRLDRDRLRARRSLAPERDPPSNSRTIAKILSWRRNVGVSQVSFSTASARRIARNLWITGPTWPAYRTPPTVAPMPASPAAGSCSARR
jgi:hypothetical protein